MKRKSVVLLSSAALLTGMLALFGPGTGQMALAEDAGEVYTVKMKVPLPSTVPSQDEVTRINDKINEITMEKLNMKLDLEIISYATYFEQIPLELSAGSDIDLIATYSSYGPTWIENGYLTDMSELLPEYGQDILNSYTTPEFATAASLNGFVFGVPVHKENSQQATMFFRTDILEKYGLDVSNIQTLSDLDALFEQVAEKEPGMWMLSMDQASWLCIGQLDYICGLQDHVIVDPVNSTEVTTLFQTEEFKEWCEYAHKWYEKGWINSGAASDTESLFTYIISGQAFSFMSTAGHPLSEADQEANCGGTDLTMITIGNPIATTSTATVFMYAIPSGSKDPAKAMQMLNLMMSDTDIMNLLNWGVEGEDYVVTEDGTLDFPEGETAETVGYHLAAGWVLPNQFMCTPWITDGPDVYDKIIEYNASADISQAFGYVFDINGMMEELMAINVARQKYMGALVTGSVDPAEYLPILNQEMTDAGADRVSEEVQRQLEEFLAQKEG